jgi:methionine sulfoxide reductase heme-binding subunit
LLVLTSYWRRLFGRRRWKRLHYAGYGAAAVFFVHGTLADPLLQNRPVDFVDAEKVYVEGCALLVASAIAWRIRARRRTGHSAHSAGRRSTFAPSP